MKILFVGVFEKRWSSTIPMAQELKRKNHDVICFDFRYNKLKRSLSNKYNVISTLKKSKKKNPILFYKKYKEIITSLLNKYNIQVFRSVKYFTRGNWKINRQLLSETKNNNYDLVLLTKTDTINYKLIPKINQFAKTWYFFMDYLKTAININAHKFASYCTWSSASYSSVNAFFKKHGANTYFITQGCNTNLFRPSKALPKKNIDVIFVGKKTQKREKYVAFLKTNGVSIECYGLGWPKGPIYLKELVAKYQHSKIILNFNQSNTGFSIRVFQVMGTRSFLLTEYCLDISKFFKKGIHLDWFKNYDDLLRKIRFYLENDEIRERIAKEGFNCIKDNFTWEKIMNRIIKIVEHDIKKEK